MNGWEIIPVHGERLTVTCLRAAVLLCLTPRVLLQRGMLAVALLMSVGLLAACSGPPPSSTLTARPMPTPTLAPTPTAAPAPTPTAVPAPTATAALPPRQVATPIGLVLNEPGAAPGYTLFKHKGTKYAYLINLAGRLVHTWELPLMGRHARLRENGNLLATDRDRLLEIDPAGKILWDYPVKDRHHDFLPMPNGNVLLLVRERKSRAEVIAWGANPDAVGAGGLRLDYIIEVRPTGPTTGEIVWQWSVWDHLIQDFDPDQANYGIVSDHPELIDLNYRLAESRPAPGSGNWLHANAIDYNPQLDQIMLSARNFDELWIIDHSTTMEQAAGHTGGKGGRGGDLLYRWGNPAAYRAGRAADQQLYWAHQTQWIKPGLPGAGNILLFNNGAGYPGNQRFYSSIDEIAAPGAAAGYQLPAGAAAPPALWSYTAQPPEGWYSDQQSGAQRLPNGNTLIVDTPKGTIFEVTPAGKTVWKYINPTTSNGPLRQGEPMPFLKEGVWDNALYRAYRYPPDYPGLQNLDLTPGDPIELPAAAR